MKPQIRKVFGKWWWSCPACYRTRSTPDWAQAQTAANNHKCKETRNA